MIQRVRKRGWAAVMLLTALLFIVPTQTLADDGTGYPMGTVKWDRVSAENLPMMKQLFNDLRLVPEGGDVKKFYITVNEVRSDLWAALMTPPVLVGDTAGDAVEEETTVDVEVAPTESTINQFITLLRQQTGKRFRLPTEQERKWTAECQVIDTIADKVDSYGVGFHLALDTIGIAKPMMLVITAKDGSQSVYRLRSKPRVTVEKPNLIIRADGTQIIFDLDELRYMRYEEDSTPTGIDRVETESRDAESRESIRFGNLPDDTTVAVYTLDGKLLHSRHADGNTLSLPLDNLASGIYIVKVNGITYKIQKP